jgi:UDP-3-O-[3-hydroxymyristoyl] glucosamine N-acyltransferase
VREIPQLGGVVIEDDVYIGACCTIAAGTIAPTVIRRGVKLDAQVHVGHNCDVGEGTIIAAQSGLAGSVVVGKGVMMGGQVGVADHITIGDGAKIAAKSGVIGDVAAGATFAGYPAVERGRWLRGLAALYRLMERSPAEPSRV